jgi:hypothetical protein
MLFTWCSHYEIMMFFLALAVINVCYAAFKALSAWSDEVTSAVQVTGGPAVSRMESPAFAVTCIA